MIATQTKLTISNKPNDETPLNTVLRTNAANIISDDTLMDLNEEWDSSDKWIKPFSENITAVLGR